MNVGEIWAAFRIDGSKAKADATKAGSDAGDAAGAAMGARLKKGAAVIGAAVAGGLSIALIGRMAALDKATAAFRAETGATADEAKRAGKAINDMAGRNIQSVEEIGATLTKVHTDLGLTGDEAERVTETFLKFAQATGQNAAEAVQSFDDILDSWGLTAADASGLMDKLILSHQKYGGTLEDNQATLAALAPAMKAANFQIDDAIALLNLFGAKGIDANTASAAFAKALTKVKSPEQLKAMIEDISSTGDGFARATKAGDLFGARAGAKLGNALAGAHLDDYKVSLDDAKGATDKAADASLTFADKIKLAFSNIISGATDVLGPAGPLLTAIGGLAPLLGPALSRAWKALVGDFGLKAAIGAAGAAAGAIYSGAEAVVSAFADGMGALWKGLAGRIGPVIAEAGAAAGAIFAGAESGSGFIASILSAIAKASVLGWFVIPFTIQLDSPGKGKSLADSWAQDMTQEFKDALSKMDLGQLQTELARVHGIGDTIGESLIQGYIDRLRALGPGEDFGALVADKLQTSRFGPKWWEDQGTADGTAVVKGATTAVISNSLALKTAARQAWQDTMEGAQGAVDRGIRAMVRAFTVAPVDMKNAIKDGKREVVAEFRDLEWQIRHPQAEKKLEEWLRDKYADAIANAAAATKAGRPGLAAEWKGAADDIKAKIDALPRHAAQALANTAASLAAVRDAIATTVANVAGAVNTIGANIAGIFGPSTPSTSRGTVGTVPFHHRASGGPEPVGPYWVGEHGPELHWGDGRGYITSAAQSFAIAGAASPQRLDVHIHAEGDGMARAGIGVADLGRWVTDALLSASDSAHIGSLKPRGA